MVQERIQLDPDDHYDGGNTHQYIVVHGTGNKTDSDEGNANFFCGGKRDSSAHKFVDDDSFTTLVKDEDCAFHCGDGHGAYGITNRNSLGIEMCQKDYKITETTQANAIQIIKAWMLKYNIPIERVVRHYDASRKNCPEALNYNNWQGWYEFKNKLAIALNNSTKFGWYQIGGKWYYYNASGMVKNGWAQDSHKKWFWLGEDGAMITNGWALWKDYWYYMGMDGAMFENQWAYWEDGAYYLGPGGKMLANTTTPDGYHVDADGAWDGKSK